MAWLKFTRRFDWRVRAGLHVAYLAGTCLRVPQACAAAATEAGAAKPIPTPNRKKAARLRRIG